MSELWGIARFKFHEGKLEGFKRLSAQAMEIVRTTPARCNTTPTSMTISPCIVLERYRDCEAAIEHASNLGDIFEAVLPRSPSYMANSSAIRAELRAKLAGSEVPVLFTPYHSI